MLKRVRCSVTLFLLLLSFVAVRRSFPQADINLPAASPYQPVDAASIDQVNLSNAGVQLNIPLVSFKQRGALSLDFTLRYTSPVFAVGQSCIPTKQCTYSRDITYSSVFISSNLDVQLSPVTYVIPNTSINTGYYWQLSTPDGSAHKLALVGSGVFRSLDSTGWIYNENTHVLTSRDGTNYVYFIADKPSDPSFQTPQFEEVLLSYIEDTNGNRISFQYSGQLNAYTFTGWTDTLGRQIPSPSFGYGENPYNYGAGGFSSSGASPDTSGCTGNIPSTGSFSWTVPGYKGAETYKFCITTVSITITTATTPNGSGTTEQQPYTYLESVVLPAVDGNDKAETWSFQYTPLPQDNYSFSGELTQVTLPEGGTLSYDWGGGNGKQFCQDLAPGSAGYPKIYPMGITSRTMNGGSGPAERWSYSPTNEQVDQTTKARSIVSAVSDSLGQRVVHTLTGLLNTCSYYETQTQYFGISGALVRTDSETYNQQQDMDAFPTSYPLAMAGVPHSKTETWANGAAKQSVFTYDSGFTAQSWNNQYSYTASASGLPYGQLLNETDSDYGSGSSGSILKTINTTYQSSIDPAALINNLLDRPSIIVTTDGATAQTQTVKYGYDESGLQTGNASATGWNSTPLSTKRGNQTSVNEYWDTAGAYVPTTKVYFDTGEVQSVTDPLTHTTSYQYSTAYDAAYLTTVINALNQSTQYTYDLSSGLLGSVTDANNVATTYGYDPAWRLQSVTRPGGDHNLAMSIGYSYPDANTIQKTTSLSSQAGLETDITVYDGLGRVAQAHHVDPEGDTYVDTTYDALGRKGTVSTPYRSKADPSFYGLTTYSYDVLNRPTQIQNPDNSASTFQYAGGTTLSTTESNSTSQNHQLQKLSRVDGLGRLINACEVTSTPPPVGTESPASCGLEIPGNRLSDYLYPVAAGNDPGDTGGTDPIFSI